MAKEKFTPEEAISVLPEGDRIHTFRNSQGMLFGADWKRDKLEAAIRKAGEARITVGMAKSTNHGIVIVDETGPLFIETNKTLVAAVEELSSDQA